MPSSVPSSFFFSGVSLRIDQSLCFLIKHCVQRLFNALTHTHLPERLLGLRRGEQLSHLAHEGTLVDIREIQILCNGEEQTSIEELEDHIEPAPAKRDDAVATLVTKLPEQAIRQHRSRQHQHHSYQTQPRGVQTLHIAEEAAQPEHKKLQAVDTGKCPQLYVFGCSHNRVQNYKKVRS